MSPNPSIVNAVLCDHVWRDPSSGKWNLLGVFEWLNADETPIEDVTMDLYLQITGLRGVYDFSIEIVHAEKDEVVVQLDLPQSIECMDPFKTMQAGISLPPVVLPEHGKYMIKILANGQSIHEIKTWALPNGIEP